MKHPVSNRTLRSHDSHVTFATKRTGRSVLVCQKKFFRGLTQFLIKSLKKQKSIQQKHQFLELIQEKGHYLLVFDAFWRNFEDTENGLYRYVVNTNYDVIPLSV